MLASADSLASNPHLFTNLTFDPAKDLVPVVQLTRQPVVLQAVNDLVGGTPAECSAKYRADYVKYARLIKELNIRLE